VTFLTSFSISTPQRAEKLNVPHVNYDQLIMLLMSFTDFPGSN
jgi:hypothetical protein